MSDSRPSLAGQLVNGVLFAPLGVGARLVDELPARITSVQQQIDAARLVGKLAVDQGVDRLRARLAGDAQADVADPPRAEAAAAASAVPSAPAVESSNRDDHAGGRQTAATSADALALADYDQQPASHIISKLDGLTSEELLDIETYELANRGRRTIIGKISQLRGTGSSS